MADFNTKLGITIDEKGFSKSVTAMLNGLENQTVATVQKVRDKANRAAAHKLTAATTTDPGEAAIARKMAAQEEQLNKKNLNRAVKQRTILNDALAATDKKAGEKRAKEQVKELNKQMEMEAKGLRALKGGLLFGARGTAAAAGAAEKGGGPADQRKAMFDQARASVGMHAAGTMASTLGGALGGKVFSNLAQGGLVEGGGRSATDTLSWGIQKTLGAGQHVADLGKRYAGGFTTLEEGRKGYNKAVGVGMNYGLSREQASSFSLGLGRAGASPEGMKGVGLMESRFGLGGESIGFLGAAAKFGQRTGGKAGSENKMLMEAVAKGTASGLKIGRLPEFFGTVTSILHGVQPGNKAHMGAAMDFVMGLGKAGFTGDQGKVVSQSLDQLAKGGGTPLSQAIALKSLGGFGEPGVDYVEAKQRMQRSLFEGTDKKTGDTPAARFAKLFAGFKDAIPDPQTMKFALGEASGLGLDAVEKLMKKMEGGGILTDEDIKSVKPTTETEKLIMKIGDLQTPMDIMEKKITTTFAGVFDGADFKQILKVMTETLPVIASGIGKLIELTAVGVTGIGDKLGKTASDFLDFVADPSAAVKKAFMGDEDIDKHLANAKAYEQAYEVGKIRKQFAGQEAAKEEKAKFDKEIAERAQLIIQLSGYGPPPKSATAKLHKGANVKAHKVVQMAPEVF